MDHYSYSDSREHEEKNISCIGIRCSAGPHRARAMDEALGHSFPAGEYSPELNLHPVMGNDGPAKGYCFGSTEEHGLVPQEVFQFEGKSSSGCEKDELACSGLSLPGTIRPL